MLIYGFVEHIKVLFFFFHITNHLYIYLHLNVGLYSIYGLNLISAKILACLSFIFLLSFSILF